MSMERLSMRSLIDSLSSECLFIHSIFTWHVCGRQRSFLFWISRKRQRTVSPSVAFYYIFLWRHIRLRIWEEAVVPEAGRWGVRILWRIPCVDQVPTPPLLWICSPSLQRIIEDEEENGVPTSIWSVGGEYLHSRYSLPTFSLPFSLFHLETVCRSWKNSFSNIFTNYCPVCGCWVSLGCAL